MKTPFRKSTSLLLALLALILVDLGESVPAHAQSVTAPCGVVDGIDYPIDGISLDHDDFGLYRAPFQGRHAGIDMAFDRRGDPVRAAARGRVTLADPNAWDTEKHPVFAVWAYGAT
jgi:murein DD-endopeptidase MepM/ murein hydrolase activator NlpD